MKNSEHHRVWLNSIALLTALCTLVLIFLGGMVTSKHAGMSVPDWPNSYGYNMFLFPPSRWVGGILFEHTHRLLGTIVGFCATVLTLIAWAPGQSARGRRMIIIIFAWLGGLNLLGTCAMALAPAMFHLTPPASDPLNIMAQGMVTEVGMLVTALVAFYCRRAEPQPWVRWIAASCLIAICVQGLLGGLRVDLINLPLAIVHGCFAQVSFCLILLAWIVTSRWWQSAPDLSGVASFSPSPGTPGEGWGEGSSVQSSMLDVGCSMFEFERTSNIEHPTSNIELNHPHPNPNPEYRERGPECGRFLIRLAIVSVCIVFGQLIVGAIMRHLQAGLAIPDLPWAYGKLLPPMNQSDLNSANNLRAWKLNLDPVTLGQIWLHFGHRMGAILVSATLLTLIAVICTRHRNQRDLVAPAVVLGLLLATQVTLGLLSVYLRKPADIASLHVAVGALVLGTTFFIAVRAMRLYCLWGRDLNECASEDRLATRLSSSKSEASTAGVG